VARRFFLRTSSANRAQSATGPAARRPRRPRRWAARIAAVALLGILALAGASVVRADPPVGDFTFSPVPAQVGASVGFVSSASDADDPLTVGWDFGDGGPPGSGLTASHSYSSPGDKTVTMTMDNGFDPAVVVTHTVHVNAPPVADFIFSPQTPTTSQQVRFSSTSSDPDPGDTLSYSWDLDGNGVFGDSAGASPTFTYGTPGTYNVGLQVTDSSGATNTLVQPVTIQNSQPSADFSSAPAAPMLGQPVTFTASATPTAGQTITAIEWDFDYAGTASQFQADASGAGAARAFPTSGVHTVAMRATESGGGFVIVTHTLTVDAPPVAAFGFAPRSPVAGDTVTFVSSSIDPDSPITNTAWDLNGDGRFNDASGPAASKRFTSPGSYTIGLDVTDAQGATSFALAQVNVRPVAPALGVLQNVLVQLAGSVTGTKTTVERLYVRAPVGAGVTVRCRGRGCPTRAVSRRLRGHRLRFRKLERTYGPGTEIIVTVAMPGFVDRVTSFKTRKGRPPRRLDQCRRPGRAKLTRCPS
jgi:PKD repeat protein